MLKSLDDWQLHAGFQILMEAAERLGFHQNPDSIDGFKSIYEDLIEGARVDAYADAASKVISEYREFWADWSPRLKQRGASKHERFMNYQADMDTLYMALDRIALVWGETTSGYGLFTSRN